jgi:hypothetical protein
MRRILVGSLVGVLLTASSAFAADDSTATALTPAIAAAATTLAQRPELAAGINFAPRRSTTGRPLVLPTLYASSAVLQGYDAYSTLNAIKHGATEANPVMKGVTRSPMAFIGLKAGVTVMSIMAAERMWKNNNRLGAVLTMVASNSMMAMVAAHNASVLARVK